MGRRSSRAPRAWQGARSYNCAFACCERPMPEILALRGRAALSPFRIAKLRASLDATCPDHRIASLSARYWHLAETLRPLRDDERATLERLLTYGPADRGGEASDGKLLVVPRPGTISPWSSKATDIARNCGLDAVARIERGIALRHRARSTARRSRLPIARRCCRWSTIG